MEKKTKTLYILSIIAIIAFLSMQAYWLYGRYDYTLLEYEIKTQVRIDSILNEYDQLRTKSTINIGDVTTTRTINNLNIDVDSLGRRTSTATVKTRTYNAIRLLGITEKRKLTKNEMEKLSKLLEDSLLASVTRVASFDVSSAPDDGAAWSAMNRYELDVRSPFTVEGIDSLLRKDDIRAEVSLAVTDSMIWKTVVMPHTSIFNPHFVITHPYSELEKKSVVIDCSIPTAEIFRQMGWTLVLATVLSIFLIMCLVWQIKTIAKLTRLDKMRNLFVTTMIHELKRPISTLKMYVSGIESDKLMADNDFRKEVAGETRMALDNLSAYFSKLRDITFNNVDEIPLSITSFNLAGLIGHVLQAAAIPRTKTVVFKNEVPEEMTISADRQHMSNILTNLVENAIKYSGDEVTVEISAQIADGSVAIDVSDNGYGIQSADRNKIFNRFYRGKAPSTDIPGMGLGLAYVKLLVEAHSGDVSVESREGIGSTFTIKLPQ